MNSTPVSEAIIEVCEVSKIYRSYTRPSQRMLELLSPGRKQYFRETRALDGVTLSLMPGSRLGIVGENGSGKSTLLKVLCGVLTPSGGSVSVRGRISALLELGAGFNPELSGRENIRQFCMLHGMQHDEIAEALPEIIHFSELQDAIEHPVKTYSSGMAVRLGFSCAVYVKPEILIVDEALSVGDAYFQNKCLHKIKSLLDGGTTFLYVTHSADGIRSLCDQGLWLENGKVRLQGSSREVGAAYQSEVFRRMASAGLQKNVTVARAPSAEKATKSDRHQAFADRVESLRTGSGEVRIQEIVLLDEQGAETDHVPFASQLCVRVFYQALQEAVSGLTVTLGITDDSGRQLMHFNAAAEGIFIPADGSHVLRVMEFTFNCPLCPGEYGLIAGIGSFVENPVNRGQLLIGEITDYCAGGARFSISYPEDGQNVWGVVHAPCSVSQYSLD
ncbi:lipopolysaccharide transport system ATP-binding protein [Pseudomonas pohangensis]|uniref:Lipopolysaccharide transport system ATP-binding protein n=1 Tax=Pseudomonas pohangensis TaxID=364197 RepID=A0A1H2HRI4_9PSED|nr:ABC transporter ATP-binding protein [Pseudomonas pohangensis]SDU34336.1 lipopolysaccharide transport system ATP-binding protein [Pseudomonas pohangensis]